MGVTESRLLATLPAEKGLATGLNYFKRTVKEKAGLTNEKAFFLSYIPVGVFC